MSDTTGTDITSDKINRLLKFLLENCEGPREAIGLLCSGIIAMDEFNARQLGIEPTTQDDLADKMSAAIRSAKAIPQVHH